MTRFGRDRDRELDDEIATHLSLAEDEYRRSGMSDDEARDAARRAFGGVVKIRQIYREQRRWRWLDVVSQDAAFGLRMLVRHRAFALTAIAVLGIGIGVNNMQFTIIYAHTLRGLPIEAADRVLMAAFVDERGADRNLSYVEYQDLALGAEALGAVAALGPVTSIALGDPGRAPDRYLATYTTGSALDVIGIRPIIGRSFVAEEEVRGGRRAALLGAGAWRARYGTDPAILGREVLVNGEPATVVGVLAERSGFPSNAEVLLPIVHAPGFSPTARDARLVRLVGRVRDDRSVDAAGAQLQTALSEIAAAGGDATKGLRPRVTPINDRFLGRASDPAWMAFFAVGVLVVAVSAANAANLMLARGVTRARELAIRGSLGATRARVIVQLLVESAVIAGLAAGVGLIVSLAGVRLFQSGVPVQELPYWWRYSMDGTVFTVLVLVSFATILVFGLVPAAQTARADVSRVLKDGGWGGAGRTGHRWLTTAFMVAQLSLSVVLMSYVVVDLVDRDAALESDGALRTQAVLTARLNLPADRYATVAGRADFYRRLQERIRAIPGVTGAAITNALPGDGAAEWRLQRTAGTPAAQLPAVWTVLVSDGYFETLKLPLMRGDDFNRAAASGDGSEAIVNHRFVEMFAAGEPLVGRRVTVLPPNPRDGALTPVLVSAIAPDIRHRPGRRDPIVYLPLSRTAPALVSVLVRSSLPPDQMLGQLRHAVFELDPHLPVFQAATLERFVQDAGWNVRVSARLVTVLSLIVLLLSSVGLYAVTAHAITQRSKEFGIRVAVGARPGQIRRLVVRGAALQVALGLLFGIMATAAWDGAFFDGRVDTSFANLRVLGPIASVLGVVMASACFAPTRRATRLDPIATLRQD